MNNIEIVTVSSKDESEKLDSILWDVLWKPLDLPRNIRESFRLEGKSLELVAKLNGIVLGGLVANWTSPTEVELRHIVLDSEIQNQGVGSKLVKKLIKTVSERKCLRIHTITRNSSVVFFKKLGFSLAEAEAPQHPVFQKHGITLKLMQITL
jgi:N-acetylglutamate synthase-like GNAT family acetyltransferase